MDAMHEDAAARRKRLIAAAVVFTTGALLAVQGRMNAALGERVDPVSTIAVTNLQGLLLLSVIVLGTTKGRASVRRLVAARPPFWQVSAGVFGMAIALSAAYLMPVTGVALFVIVVTATQTVASLLADRVGLAPGGRRAMTPARLVGVALAIAAVVIGGWGSEGSLPPLVALVIVAAGIGAIIPAAANGHLTHAAGSPYTATWLNFVAGSIVIYLLFAGHIVLHGWPGGWPTNPGYYVGGVIAAIYVVSAAAGVHALGVLGVTLATVAGNLSGGLALDVISPANGQPVSPGTFVAAVLTAAAVVVTTYRRAPRRASLDDDQPVTAA